jgi:hypothetical protein
MQKVLSPDLWKTVKIQARKAQQRKVAIAYVTSDLIGFRKGDVIVLDASTQAIASGQTDAHLLRKLQQDQVRIYNCTDLHAKVMLLGDVAVIGSGNLSNSSANNLVEVAVMTDNVSTVSAVASFIHQLVNKSKELLPAEIDQLCNIKVISGQKRGRSGSRPGRKTAISPLGHRTWLIGVRPDEREPTLEKQKSIDKAIELLRSRSRNPDYEPSRIEYPSKSRFGAKGRQGDSIIQIWRPSHEKRPSKVNCIVPVLMRRKHKHSIIFYLPPEDVGKSLTWGKFQRLLTSLGYSCKVGPHIQRKIESDTADAIRRRWHSAKKTNRRTKSKS